MQNSRAHINTQKIKGIIACHIHRGEQVCADKINQGGFPPPGHARKWGPEHIKPMMAGEISLKPVTRQKYYHVGTTVSRTVHDIVFRNSATNSGFLRAAILEKIEREGLI